MGSTASTDLKKSLLGVLFTMMELKVVEGSSSSSRLMLGEPFIMSLNQFPTHTKKRFFKFLVYVKIFVSLSVYNNAEKITSFEEFFLHFPKMKILRSQCVCYNKMPLRGDLVG